MRQFSTEYPINEIGSQLVTQLPWGHIQELIFNVNNTQIRGWYIEKTIEAVALFLGKRFRRAIRENKVVC